MLGQPDKEVNLDIQQAINWQRDDDLVSINIG